MPIIDTTSPPLLSRDGANFFGIDKNGNYDIYILMIECYKKYHKKSTLTQIDTLISIITHSKTTKTLEYIKNQFSKHPEIYKILPKQTKKLIKI